MIVERKVHAFGKLPVLVSQKAFGGQVGLNISEWFGHQLFKSFL